MLRLPSRTRVVTFVTSVVLLATPAAAQDIVVQSPAPATPKPAPRLRGMARFGAEGGGDAVMQFRYEDGSEPEVSAGGGLHLSAGITYRAMQAKAGGLDAQLGVGLKWRTIPPAENQDANWLRFPLDGMLVFRSTRGFGIGAGATVHFANSLRVSGDVADGNVKFETAPGVLVQAEYAWRGARFDVRYTGIQYQVTDTSERIDASSVGAGITFLFGRH